MTGARHHHPTRGIALAVCATLCFALLDTVPQYVGPLVLPWAWAPMADGRLWALAGLLGVFGSVGHHRLIQAHHPAPAPASRLTSYMYAHIAFATLAGWVVFGHTPDAWTGLGVALIALCGGLGVRLRHG